MKEDKHHPKFFSEKDAPIPIPPAEDAWMQMRQRLDAEMPDSAGWGKWKGFREISSRLARFLASNGWILAGLILVGLASAIVYLSKINQIRTVKTAKIRQDSTSIIQSDQMPSNRSGSDPHLSNHPYSDDDSSYANKNLNRIPNPAFTHKSASLRKNQNKPNVTRQKFSIINGQEDQRIIGYETNNIHSPENSVFNKREGLKSDHTTDFHKASSEARLSTEMQLAVVTPSSQISLNHSVIQDSLLDNNLKLSSTSLGIVKKQSTDSAHSAHSKTTINGPANKSAHPMALGIEIKKLFAIGEQESSPYNIHAGDNLLSDYIPGIYFNYQLNKRLNIKAAFHFSSPQYCRSTEIYRQNDSLSVPTNVYTTEQTTVTLNKLYYMDIPLSLHYRVLDHFSLGLGLQFSMLKGGVGMLETRYLGYGGTIPDSIASQGAISLKEQPDAYSELKKMDWRVLVDANYQWRRFSIGLRYQQALASYLKSSATSSGSNEMNSAIGIYLQMDLWRKK